MFQANHITESLHRQTGKKEVFEFPCGIPRGRIINDMVVNVAAIDMSTDDKSVIAFEKAFCKFISDTVGFFRRDFSRFE